MALRGLGDIASSDVGWEWDMGGRERARPRALSKKISTRQTESDYWVMRPTSTEKKRQTILYE